LGGAGGMAVGPAPARQAEGERGGVRHGRRMADEPGAGAASGMSIGRCRRGRCDAGGRAPAGGGCRSAGDGGTAGLRSQALSLVHVFTDDLLFGSRLASDLTAAGHEVTVGPRPDRQADAIVADLTFDADVRIAALSPPRPPTLAFFSHVDAGVRTRALAAGIELVVPRSRVAREGPALLAGLLATGR